MRHIPVPTATRAWHDTLSTLLFSAIPEAVAPRGQPTRELPHDTMIVDMRYPVVISPTRKLSEKFLGAEAHWILSGDDRVSTIAPYNSRIEEFSDDGQTFFGAYGPRWLEQIGGAIAKLRADPMTRQAGLTFWRPNPPRSKDVPCTVAMFFSLRNAKLHSHTFMRSSDIWLGVPYDVFNFSMLAHYVCAALNEDRLLPREITPGTLYLTAASRHLYDRDRAKAEQVVVADTRLAPTLKATWPDLYTSKVKLLNTLDAIRHEVEGAKWWKP